MMEPRHIPSLQSHCPFATSLLAPRPTCYDVHTIDVWERGSSRSKIKDPLLIAYENQGNAADSGLEAFIGAARRLGWSSRPSM
jgi:hypothetical protein